MGGSLTNRQWLWRQPIQDNLSERQSRETDTLTSFLHSPTSFWSPARGPYWLKKLEGYEYVDIVHMARMPAQVGVRQGSKYIWKDRWKRGGHRASDAGVPAPNDKRLQILHLKNVQYAYLEKTKFLKWGMENIILIF